jgi:hypothetical protein
MKATENEARSLHSCYWTAEKNCSSKDETELLSERDFQSIFRLHRRGFGEVLGRTENSAQAIRCSPRPLSKQARKNKNKAEPRGVRVLRRAKLQAALTDEIRGAFNAASLRIYACLAGHVRKGPSAPPRALKVVEGL